MQRCLMGRGRRGEGEEEKGKGGGLGVYQEENQQHQSISLRILNSLFIDFLKESKHTYTLSVFVPESGMLGRAPLSRDEMMHLLGLKSLHPQQGQDGDSSGAVSCLALELLNAFQQMGRHRAGSDAGTQTIDTAGSHYLEGHLREVEAAFERRLDVERLMPYRTLEERMSLYRKECDERMRAEVTLQVSRVREFEVGAARIEEGTRYRRQLEEAREELERVHADRLERLRAREDSHMERIRRREKALESAAYEHRQRILVETEALRERELQAKQVAELQEKGRAVVEERLAEREAAVKVKEADVQRIRDSLYALGEEQASMRRREVEREYEGLMRQLKSDRDQLEVERERFAEERRDVANEVAAARADRDRARALEHSLACSRSQHDAVEQALKDVEERLRQREVEGESLRAKLLSVTEDLAAARSQLSNMAGVVREGQREDGKRLETCRQELQEAKVGWAEERQARQSEREAACRDVQRLRESLAAQMEEVKALRRAREDWVFGEENRQALVRRLEAEAAELVRV